MFIRRSIHYNQKGIKYIIKSLARHSETGEFFIIYQKNENNSEIWIKNLVNFKKNLINEDIIEFEKIIDSLPK